MEFQKYCKICDGDEIDPTRSPREREKAMPDAFIVNTKRVHG